MILFLFLLILFLSVCWFFWRVGDVLEKYDKAKGKFE